MPRDDWQKPPYSAVDIETAVHLRNLDCGHEALRFELAKDYLTLTPSQFASIVRTVQADLLAESDAANDYHLPLLSICYEGNEVDSIDLLLGTDIGIIPLPIFDVDSAQDTVNNRHCD